jgi:hypothetical protein
MALDPRIALQGVQWQAPDILGAVRQGQDIRKNNMAMARQVAADEALFNYFNPPPGARPMNLSAADQGAIRGFQDVFASMPAGVGRGPPITGQPLPSVGAPPASRMASRAAAAVASAVAPPAAPAPPMANAMRAAPAADVRSAMMARMAPAGARPDISTLMPFADDPRVKAVLDQRAAQQKADAEAAAKAPADTRAGVEFTNNLIGRAAINLLDDPSDEAIDIETARLLRIPGINAGLVNENATALKAIPFDQRSQAVRRMTAVDAGTARASGLDRPNLVSRSDGASTWFEDINPDSRTFGERYSREDLTLTPAQVKAEENRAEDQDREWFDTLNERNADVDATRTALSLARPGPDRDAAQIDYGKAVARRNAHERTGPPGAAPAPRVSDGPPPRSDAIVDVTTPAQANALPPGTRYRTPDGQLYTR